MEGKLEVFPLNSWNIKVPVLELGHDLLKCSSGSVENMISSVLLGCFSWLPTHSRFSLLYSFSPEVCLMPELAGELSLFAYWFPYQKLVVYSGKSFSQADYSTDRIVCMVGTSPQLNVALIFFMLLDGIFILI